MNPDTLNQNYKAREYDDRVLLTFTGADVSGWDVVSFQ
jgi:hypothetical protein